MFKKIILTISVMFIIINDELIAKVNINDQLKSKVNVCLKNIYDFELDKEMPESKYLILDYKNGYVHANAPTSMTCGCECTSTATVFYDVRKDPTIIEYQTVSCSWHREVKSSKSFGDIFPIDFAKEFGFSGNNKKFLDNYYLEINLPRRGTNTVVLLKQMPFGTKRSSNGKLYFGLQGGGNANQSFKIEKYAMETGYIGYVLDDKIKVLSELLKGVKVKPSEALISKLKRHSKTIDDLNDDMQIYVDMYKNYTKIKYKSLILNWDKKRAKFNISKKIKSRPISLEKFMQQLEHYSPKC